MGCQPPAQAAGPKHRQLINDFVDADHHNEIWGFDNKGKVESATFYLTRSKPAEKIIIIDEVTVSKTARSADWIKLCGANQKASQVLNSGSLIYTSGAQSCDRFFTFILGAHESV